ncbi:hypothetical protein F4804DRAFT_232088 [Jackrogersella minutella]|nr:hypothetical protein F4804DRAFT_232088 [Jackrogersella minutella]
MASAQMTPDRGLRTAILAVGGIAIVLNVISVALRFYTRIFTGMGLGHDDWLIFVGAVMTVVITALVFQGSTNDTDGVQASENRDPNYHYTASDVHSPKYPFSAAVLYFTAMSATKLGILFMYFRIFARNTVFRYQLFASGGLVICWWIICSVLATTICLPHEENGQQTGGFATYCHNFNTFWMVAGVCEILIDTIILTLPVGVVLRIRLSFRQRFSVLGIFLLGSFVIITGVVKAIFGYDPDSREPSYTTQMNYSRTDIWGLVHACTATICACLPILRPLIHRVASSSSITKISVLLSARRTATNRRSGNRLMVDRRGGESRNYDSNTMVEPSCNLPPRQADIAGGDLQQPDAVHLDTLKEPAGVRQIPRTDLHRHGQMRAIRRSQMETAESFMTFQLASYLEYGTDNSDSEEDVTGRS